MIGIKKHAGKLEKVCFRCDIKMNYEFEFSQILQFLFLDSLLSLLSVRNNLMGWKKLWKFGIRCSFGIGYWIWWARHLQHPVWYTYSFSQNMCGVQVENEKQLIIIIIDRRVILLDCWIVMEFQEHFLKISDGLLISTLVRLEIVLLSGGQRCCWFQSS